MFQFLKKNKKITIPAAIVLVLVGIWLFGRSGPTVSQYQTVPLERGQLVATVGATGTVRARQSATLTWQTNGTVDSASASVGDRVAAGAILADLLPTSVSQNIILAQADLVTAQQALDDLKASDTARAQAYLTLISAQDAYTSASDYRKSLNDPYTIRVGGSVRTAEADATTIADADAQLALATAQLDDAQRAYDRVKDGPNADDLAAAQARVDAALATLNMARLVAPFAGTITEAHPLTGDQVTTGTVGYRIDDLSSMLVDVEISEVDINSIKSGQPATITFDAILDGEYHGTIVDVSQAGTVSSGVVSFIVTVEISDADARVKPGMTAAVTITVEQQNDVVLIPNRAVRLVNGVRVVYVERGGQSVKVEVSLGSSSDTYSVLLSGDVQVGEQIILNPQVEFQPGGAGGGRPNFGN